MASSVDEKKEINTTSIKSFANNIKNFLKSILVSVLHVLIWFFISGLVLYSCKLAQSNIMPTNTNCYPYRHNKPTISNMVSDIFFTWFTEPQMSMKINFPYDKYNSFSSIIDDLRGFKESPRAVFILNYFISILEDVISCTYSCFNYLFNFYNQMLPEFIVILLGPVLLALTYIITFFCVIVNFLYSWIINTKWFFKKNVACPSEERARWESVPSMSFRYILGIILLVIALFSIFMMIPIGMILSILLLISCTISIGLYKANFNNEKITFLTVVKDIFKFYKFTIMAVLSYFVIRTAFTNLGRMQGIICCIVVLCIYFGWITINMFKSSKETNLSPLIDDYELANKRCVSDEVCPTSGGKGIFSFFSGGGNITNKLKNMNKNMNKSGKK
jgi:hypothetical protein